MTDYNDGKWHGWNGGECPVHPKSELEAVCVSTMPGGYGRVTWRHAGDMTWDSETSAIIAFRVVKEHRKPREWWVDPSTDMAYDYPSTGWMHVREVLE